MSNNYFGDAIARLDKVEEAIDVLAKHGAALPALFRSLDQRRADEIAAVIEKFETQLSKFLAAADTREGEIAREVQEITRGRERVHTITLKLGTVKNAFAGRRERPN